MVLYQVGPGTNWLTCWQIVLLDANHNPTSTVNGASTVLAQYKGIVEFWAFDTLGSLTNGFAWVMQTPPSTLGAPPTPVSTTAYFTVYGNFVTKWQTWSGTIGTTNAFTLVDSGGGTWYLVYTAPTQSAAGNLRWIKPSAAGNYLWPAQAPGFVGKAIPLASSTSPSSYVYYDQPIPPL